MNDDILLFHFANYPVMRPRDAIKLCYQSTFGVEHLLTEKERALAYLRQELAQTESCGSEAAYELIGGGYARLNLKSLPVRNFSPEEIIRMMEKSVGRYSRTMEDCFQALQRLRILTREGKAPFSLEELDKEIELFRLSGCQPVHHSEIFRSRYAPAYRVILAEDAVSLFDLY